jgi:hypothetical protein
VILLTTSPLEINRRAVKTVPKIVKTRVTINTTGLLFSILSKSRVEESYDRCS